MSFTLPRLRPSVPLKLLVTPPVMSSVSRPSGVPPETDNETHCTLGDIQTPSSSCARLHKTFPERSTSQLLGGIPRPTFVPGRTCRTSPSRALPVSDVSVYFPVYCPELYLTYTPQVDPFFSMPHRPWYLLTDSGDRSPRPSLQQPFLFQEEKSVCSGVALRACVPERPRRPSSTN